MKKRRFLKNTTVIASAMALSPLTACKKAAKDFKDGFEAGKGDNPDQSGTISLPPLDYTFDALAPNIDARTMEIHHDKHHAGYVKKFNISLKGLDIRRESMPDILASIEEKDTGLRNNGGGHYNHSLFWKSMSPNGGKLPTGDLVDAINAEFGNFDEFKIVFSNAAKTRFGSGWAWLCQDEKGKLFVSSTPNQDNPLMSKIVEKRGTPLLGLDVWEHAYYLNYQNRRGDYVANFFNIIDWNTVAERLV